MNTTYRTEYSPADFIYIQKRPMQFTVYNPLQDWDWSQVINEGLRNKLTVLENLTHIAAPLSNKWEKGQPSYLDNWTNLDSRSPKHYSVSCCQLPIHHYQEEVKALQLAVTHAKIKSERSYCTSSSKDQQRVQGPGQPFKTNLNRHMTKVIGRVSDVWGVLLWIQYLGGWQFTT